MFNNKYSKLLTVILIIVIIGVVVLLGFLGYDVYRKIATDTESKEAVSRFEDELNRIYEEDVDIQNSDTNTVIPNVDLNTLVETPSDGSGEGTKKVTYKGYEVIGTIEIPKTDIKYPIIKQEDVGIHSLKVAVCNLYGELNAPKGNAVIIGHNYRNGTFFSNNKKLESGDKIYITDNNGRKVTYIVYKKYETSTSDFSYATREIGEKREISLSTCTDDSKRRLIIWAKEQ